MRHSGERWRLGRRPGLDGLRGIAILLVVVSHLGIRRFEPLGGVGVTVFFTLSGFLITAVLVEERNSRGRNQFARFYSHRAFRLAPAFAVCVTVVIGLELWQYGEAPLAWTTIAEVSNWVSATRGAGELLMLHHTWSLSIEEQFYIVWPAVLATTARWIGRRGVVAVAIAGIVASRVAAQFVSGPRLSYGTDTNAASLLIGCLLAVLMVDQRVTRAPGWALPAGLVLIMSGIYPAAGWVPVVPIGTAIAIWAVCTASPSVLTWRPLQFSGTVSYGWYLWNYPLTLLALNLGLRLWIVPLVSLMVAWLSWTLLERRFLRLRSNESGGRESSRAVDATTLRRV